MHTCACTQTLNYRKSLCTLHYIHGTSFTCLGGLPWFHRVTHFMYRYESFKICKSIRKITASYSVQLVVRSRHIGESGDRWATATHETPLLYLTAKQQSRLPTINVTTIGAYVWPSPTYFKGLSHQSCVLTESARRPEKSQNAMVRAVRSPRAQKQLRSISVGRRGDS